MILLHRNVLLFLIMFGALASVGFFQSWSLALAIVNLCLISALMSIGVNIQWGYAGLFNVGVMGFAALGGVCGVLISADPVAHAWQVGKVGLGLSLLFAVGTVCIVIVTAKHVQNIALRRILIATVLIVGYFVTRAFFDPTVELIEEIEPAKTGYLGGLGLPIVISWIVGGAVAAMIAFLIGKIALGLRSDYLAIATLGISEIIIAVLKNEDWLTRGVKNVSGLPRPVPYEIDLQQSPWFQNWATTLGATPVEFSSIFVKLNYAFLFSVVLLIIMWLSQRALYSPWGRMMRGIRDNEIAASAMGKNVKGRHLQVFVLGSAVIGIAGAMLTTLDGQFTPASYQPLRFTFLIWVMVIVGGSGNNWGAVLGGFAIWFFWVEAEPIGLWLIEFFTSGLPLDNKLRMHLMDSAAHMRLITMGLVLLLVLRFSPKGLIPER